MVQIISNFSTVSKSSNMFCEAWRAASARFDSERNGSSSFFSSWVFFINCERKSIVRISLAFSSSSRSSTEWEWKTRIYRFTINQSTFARERAVIFHHFFDAAHLVILQLRRAHLVPFGLRDAASQCTVTPGHLLLHLFEKVHKALVHLLSDSSECRSGEPSILKLNIKQNMTAVLHTVKLVVDLSNFCTSGICTSTSWKTKLLLMGMSTNVCAGPVVFCFFLADSASFLTIRNKC